MKNLILTMLFVWLHSFVFSQDSIDKKQIYIGGFLSTGISNHNNNNVIVSIPKFSFNIGIESLFQLKQKLSVSVGVLYSVRNDKTNDMNLSFSTPSTVEPTKAQFDYKAEYAEVPVRLDFYLGKGKIVPIITTGISANIFLKEKIYYTYTYQDGHKKQGSDINTLASYKVLLEYQLGAGLDIAFLKSHLRIFPLYKRSGYYNSIQLGVQYVFGTRKN